MLNQFRQREEWGVGFILVIALLGGLALRFNGLTSENHWLDELYSADFSNPARAFAEMLQRTLLDVHPPLYQTILWLCYKLFGFSEYVGRSLSAIIGALVVLATYTLGTELFNKRVGSYSALIAAANVFLIYYSQEVRSYELYVLLSVISWLLLFRLVLKPSRLRIALYWTFTACLIYTHYFSLFLIAAQFVFCLFRLYSDPDSRAQLARVGVATGVFFVAIFLPLLPYFLAKLGMGEEHTGSLGTTSPRFVVDHLITHFGFWPAIPLLVGGLVGIWSLFSRDTHSSVNLGLILLVVWVAFGFLIPYIKGLVSVSFLLPRYTIALIPPVIVFCAYGISQLGGWKRSTIMVLYLVGALYQLYANYYGQMPKAQFREVLLEVTKYDQVPIFEMIPFNGHVLRTNHYQTYAEMLSLGIEVKEDQELMSNLKDARLPKCFWAINAHLNRKNPPIEESEILLNESITLVKSIKYQRAEANLLSFEASAEYCLTQVGLGSETSHHSK